MLLVISIVYGKTLRKQTLLIPTNIEDLIPETHPCRLVDIVADRMDLSKFDEKVDGPGHPTIHPRIKIKLFLQGMVDGSRSSRRLAKNTRENVVYKWLAEGLEIDHCTLSEFRREHEDLIQEAFRQTALFAASIGMMRLSHIRIFTDGSKVKASASNDRTLTKGDLERLEEFVRWELALGVAEDRMDDSAYGRTRTGEELPGDIRNVDDIKERVDRLKQLEPTGEEEEAESKDGGIHEGRDGNGSGPRDGDTPTEVETEEGNDGKGSGPKDWKRKKIVSNVMDAFEDGDEEEREKIKEMIRKARLEMVRGGKDVVSWTDPESRFMLNKKGRIEYSYNVQITVEGESGIIVGQEVTQDYNDADQLKPQIERTEGTIGRLPKGTEVGADNGYHSGENIRYGDERKLNLFLPNQDDATEAKTGKRPEKGPFHKDNFVYDEEKDEFICPNNKRLTRWGTSTDPKKGTKTIIYKGIECEGCPFRHQCTPRSKHGVRYVTVGEYKEELKRMEQKMATPEGKEMSKERSKVVEHPFGDIKQNIGLREFLTRGVTNAGSEFALACGARNLKRICTYLIKKNVRLAAQAIDSFSVGAIASQG